MPLNTWFCFNLYLHKNVAHLAAQRVSSKMIKISNSALGPWQVVCS